MPGNVFPVVFASANPSRPLAPDSSQRSSANVLDRERHIPVLQHTLRYVMPRVLSVIALLNMIGQPKQRLGLARQAASGVARFVEQDVGALLRLFQTHQRREGRFILCLILAGGFAER